MNNQQLITTDELAGLLKLHRASLYDMKSRGLIGPMPVKLGRATRWIQSEVEAWIGAGCPCRTKWAAMRQAGGR